MTSEHRFLWKLHFVKPLFCKTDIIFKWDNVNYLHEFNKGIFPFPGSRQISNNRFVQTLTIEIFQQNCDCSSAGI